MVLVLMDKDGEGCRILKSNPCPKQACRGVLGRAAFFCSPAVILRLSPQAAKGRGEMCVNCKTGVDVVLRSDKESNQPYLYLRRRHHDYISASQPCY